MTEFRLARSARLATAPSVGLNADHAYTNATITLSGPSSGVAGVASSAFTVSLPITIPGLVITLSDGLAGGTFSTTTLSESGTFTYTAASAGAKSISLSNNLGLTVIGSPVTYTASGSSLTIGSQITTLSLYPTTTGTMPFSATILPLAGQVPAGNTLSSTGDTTMRSSVLSTHSDGSAAVVVVAGSKAVTANVATTLAVNLATGDAGIALGPDAISAQVSNITCNFGVHGTGTLTAFGSPEFVWWANSSMICARYRIPIGSSWLEAVVDVHAWAGRALVEVVIENGKLNPATAHPSNGSTYPPIYAYTGATVTVNGSVIATVNSAHTYDTAYDHRPFSAWACSTWVGGDPGIEVTHDPAYLQSHPLLFKTAVPSSVDLQALYAGSTYTPWGGGLNRAAQAGTGDHDSIGPLPKWEARYLQSGDRYARRAVLASGTALLHSNVNYRNVTTGLPLSAADVAGKTIATGSGTAAFPRTDFPFADYTANYHWDYAHQPAAGLMPFLCRPSPMFLEIAQKVATYNALGNNTGDGLLGEYFAWRGRAWGIRNITQAAFLTPDAQTAWKAAAKANLSANATFFTQWSSSGYATLNLPWDSTPYSVDDYGGTGVQQSIWMAHFLIPEVHKLHQAEVLSGSAQTTLGAFADWVALQPVRWINEQASGSWRYIGYRTVIGSGTAGSPAQMLQAADWGTQRAYANPTPPASVSGPWMSTGGADVAYSDPSWSADSVGGYQYVEPFWSSLVAAYERGVSGIDTAWQTVQTNVTGLSTWLAGGGSDPRHISFPRNYGWGAGSDVGTAPTAGNSWTWTPARTDGLVNKASWDAVPTNTWVQIANSAMTTLDAPMKAAMLATYGDSWVDVGYDTSINSWNAMVNAWVGWAWDDRSGTERFWIGPGGGHGASGNNGVYKFSAREMAWAIEGLPTPRSSYPASGYDGSTGYPLTGPEVAGPTGIGYDEVYDASQPTHPTRSSRMPTSRHTYGGGVFAPELGSAGKYLMMCRRAWAFDLATKTWALPRKYLNNDATFTFHSGENMYAWWDSATQRAYHCGNNASISGDSRNFWWDGNATFGQTGYYPSYGWTTTTSVFDKQGTTLHHLQYVHDNAPTKPQTIYRHNLATGSLSSALSVTFSGVLTSVSWPNSASTGYWDVGAITYVAPQNRYLTVIRRVTGGASGGGDEFAWIDGATGVCTLADSETGAFLNPYMCEGKIKYVPGLQAIFHMSLGYQNIRIMKVA